jgi:ABC-type dipeptide/oligopeptide/nickel transport system permease component
MSMTRYALIRLAIIVPVILLLLVLTFLLTHVLPADPAVLAAGPNPTAERVQAAAERLGLDKPVYEQLWDYFKNLAQGNLGDSLQTGNSVASDLGKRVPATLLLVTVGIIIAFVIAVAMALWTAGKESGFAGFLGRVFGSVGNAMPDYFLGLLLILCFYVWLAVLPAPLGQSGPQGATVPDRTGAYLIDAVLAGNWSAIGTALTHLILPVATLGLAVTAQIYRVARAALEEARRARYVDYAALMGCSPGYINKRVMQNAAPPVLTMTGVIYGLLLGGAVIVETIFSWGGAGQYAVNAITNNDFNAIQGFVLIVAVFSVLIYLAVDLLHAWLDPRVRSAI